MTIETVFEILKNAESAKKEIEKFMLEHNTIADPSEANRLARKEKKAELSDAEFAANEAFDVFMSVLRELPPDERKVWSKKAQAVTL